MIQQRALAAALRTHDGNKAVLEAGRLHAGGLEERREALAVEVAHPVHHLDGRHTSNSTSYQPYLSFTAFFWLFDGLNNLKQLVLENVAADQGLDLLGGQDGYEIVEVSGLQARSLTEGSVLYRMTPDLQKSKCCIN